MSSQTARDPEFPLDPRLFRRACAQFATGVTIVTVADEHGKPHGLTVNSFTSVSLDPPLVLVSIDLRNAILGHFLGSRAFAVNVLAEDQEDLSRRFSSPVAGRFEGVEWHWGASGAPVLEGVLAQLECSTVRTFEAGDHTVLLGEVKHALHREGKPLLYFNSGYREVR